MRAFLREVLSEAGDEGKGSLGRLLTLIIVFFVLGWDTGNVVFAWRFNMAHFERLIPLLPDAVTLAAQGVFMLLFYGTNKFAGTYQAINLPSPAAPSPTPAPTIP